MKTRIGLALLLLASLATLPLVAQTFISAKAGLVNYEEGVHATSPRQLTDGERFTTPNRTEILMTPGAFLRLERDAEIYMVSTRLSHPAIELTKGVASLEVDEVAKESNITLSWNEYKGDRAFVIDHKGLYRFEQSEDGVSLKVMVIAGHLRIADGPTLKDGQEVIVGNGGAQATLKFDRNQRDDFDQWGAYRASLMSTATVKTAQAMSSGSYPGSSSWVFNSFLGSFAYLPYGGMGYMSPYGYFFYSPYYIGRNYGYFGGGYYYGGNGGYYNGGGSTGPVTRASISNASGTIQHPSPRVPVPNGPSTTNPAINASNRGFNGNPTSLFPGSAGSTSSSLASSGNAFPSGGGMRAAPVGSSSPSASAGAGAAAGGRVGGGRGN